MENQKLQFTDPMSWQVSYCLDFGFCFNYPKEYWRGYFDTLQRYGFNTVWLWVAGSLPVPGFEETLAWSCEYVPEMVDYLHSKGIRVHLMSGVFGWLGMSPGLIRMHPEIEITWSEDLKKQYPYESTRRGICPTRGKTICLDYIESLYRACPQADGMVLEVFCEKPHCQCRACTDRGLWKIELDFMREISQRLWRINFNAEIIWPFGYERTHGQYPESQIYDELRGLDDPRYIWWQVRPEQGYLDRLGTKHLWMNPKELSAWGPRLLVLARSWPEVELAHQAGALGVVPVDPAGRYMFLPEMGCEHFGYFVGGPPPSPPVYDHALFHLRAFRRQKQAECSHWTPENFHEWVAMKFFLDCGDHAKDVAGYLLFLENLILDQRVCMHRSAGKVWGDINGGDTVTMVQVDPQNVSILRKITSLSDGNPWVGSMKQTAGGLLDLING